MRPKLRLDELNKALLITAGVCYLVSFVLNRYAAVNTVFRILFAAAVIFLGIRLFAGNPDKRNTENMKFLAAMTAVKEFFQKPFRKGGQPPARGCRKALRNHPGQMEAPVAGVSDLPIPHLPPVLPAAPGPSGQGQDPGHLHQMPQSVHCKKLRSGVYYEQQQKRRYNHEASH